MLLKITHQTDLNYSDLISESVMELRMAPRQEQDQHRLSFTLGVGPPTSAFSYFDWLGNTVHGIIVSSAGRFRIAPNCGNWWTSWGRRRGCRWVSWRCGCCT